MDDIGKTTNLQGFGQHFCLFQCHSSLEPIRADTLILLQSEQLVLHLEFQTVPDPAMAFRMLDYRLRVYRRFPTKQMRQVVIYLLPSTSDLVYQSSFDIPGTSHRYEVIRLWERASEEFQQLPGLLPFAALGKTKDREGTLRQVAKQIEALGDRRLQSNVTASSAILAGLVLDRGIIQRIFRSDVMKESVIYQEIRAEALDEGRQEGRQEGQRNEARSLLLRQLSKKFGTLGDRYQTQISNLALEQMESLSEALLDFAIVNDLDRWLQDNS
ncbi:MAG: Rpn family recombination-promoting nuclease/putative transposase [Pseudanabaena sp. RU_4_16]|nr:Rpn family recombination-promoting nuclease/putative transposase [Pseudanabaena sp. RU_4_16]